MHPERGPSGELSGRYVRRVISYPDPPLVAETVVLRRWDRRDLSFVCKASADAELLAGTTLPDPFTEDAGLALSNVSGIALSAARVSRLRSKNEERMLLSVVRRSCSAGSRWRISVTG